MDYKTSGVDIEAGREFISNIKQTIEETHSSNVLKGIGGFGGLFKLPISNYDKPILVSGTDGVGTKLELAQKNNAHFTVGVDLVAMCINDIITSGAKPLFFLDYIATGKLDNNSLQEVIKGIARSCKDNQCSLIGGETAEMPGFYTQNKYDLAGFCVGIVEEANLIDGHLISEKDLIIGLQSSGIHSNGYSLVRKVIENCREIDDKFHRLTDLNFYEELLKPTKIYSNLVHQLINSNIPINGMAHITGGGLPENLPRCIPNNFIADINPQSWDIPFIFQFLQEEGQIPNSDFWNTFNLGLGFCLIINPEYKGSVDEICQSNNVLNWEIGKIHKKDNCEINKLIKGLPI